MAIIASAVTAIDEIPIPWPSTEIQIEALVGRLGDIGIEAIAQTIEPLLEIEGTDQVIKAGN
jgi:hypothetical protein